MITKVLPMSINISTIKYPHIDYLHQLVPNPHIMLGRKLYIQAKEDGSNTGLYLNDEDKICIRSRNMDDASFDMYNTFANTGVKERLMDLLLSAREWGDEYVVFAEMNPAKKSPTRLKVYKEPLFVIFDIYSQKEGGFMKYEKAYQEAHHAHIPFVELYGTCNFGKLENLEEHLKEHLQTSLDNTMEGVVVKTWEWKPEERELYHIKNNMLLFKDKIDYPKVAKVAPTGDYQTPEIPYLPDSEIWGAIDKVIADKGLEVMGNIRTAMPLIAQYVSTECKQHNCKSPPALHKYYLKWKEEQA